MDLTVLLEPKLDLPRLATVLDGMGHHGRLHTIRGWGKARQAALFEAAKGFRPLSLEDFVPAHVPALTEVVHHGRNTLPVFNNFQKRFCRHEEEGVLYGYNEGATRGLTGPGYYVASARDGELVIDYRKLPTGRVAPTWPAIISNKDKLGFLVFHGMVDYMRGLSSHVAIGRAEKNGKLMDAYFVLVRQDKNPAS